MRMPGKASALATTLACALFALLSSRAIAADDYPSRPVTIVVPFTPGGSTDVLARYAAEVLQSALHQSFVVENRAGAGGVIGIGYVAKSAPDGYTLLHAPTAFGLLPHLMKSIPYDPAADFDPIALIGLTEFSLVVSPSLNVNSVADLIALAKAKPGALTYASAGIGTTQQLFAELFKSMAHVDIRHIPYKGTAPGLVDVMSGNVSMMFADIGPALSLVQGGKLKMLAVTSLARNNDMPEVPTVAETVPGYEAIGWQGLLARVGTPKSIVEKINKILVADLQRAETAARFKAIGVEARWSTPDEFRAFIAAESAKWRSVIRAAGIEPQ
ncbi:MAG: tripartite tricarboxylate transporter substrate binding protein [Xanthobacteraceae bacterium]